MVNLSSISHQKQSACSVSLQFVGQSDPQLGQTQTKEELESSQQHASSKPEQCNKLTKSIQTTAKIPMTQPPP